jgi:hypothetical protein
LEKIIQVNLNLPVATRESISQLCTEGLNEALRLADSPLTREQEREFNLAFLQLIEPGLRTPRIAKLYANAVSFALPLLAREVNAVDILLLEAIKFVYPDIYEDIRKSPQVYTGEFGWDFGDLGERGQETHAHLKRILDNIGESNARRARDLLVQLFPQLASVFLKGNYGEYDQAHAWREQRVSSLDYLQRYLTFSIPTGDISDQEIDAFVRAINDLNSDELDAKYQRLFRPEEHRNFLMKLKSRVEEIPLDSAKRLCLCIARCGSLIPETRDEIVEPRALVGFIVRLVLKRIPAEHRKEFAIEVINAAEPLPLLTLCLEWMRPQRNEAPHDQPFSLEDIVLLEQAASIRISHHAVRAPLIAGKPPDFVRLLLIWQRGHGSEPVKKYVNEVLAADPQLAGELLKPFSSFGLTGAQGIDETSYNLIAKIVDPQQLMTALERAELLTDGNASGAARLAQDFATIYRRTILTTSAG